MADDSTNVTIGQSVYTENGHEIGTIRGFDEDGFFVTTRQGVASLSVAHEHPGPGVGEAELMWRCAECGEVGDLDDGIPDECPNCGVEKEAIYYWQED